MGSKKTAKRVAPPASGAFVGNMARAVGAAVLVGIGRKIAIDLYDTVKRILSNSAPSKQDPPRSKQDPPS